MKREILRPSIYFVLAVLVGTGLHFLYEWSPNLLFALVSPVRESVWEHLKLVYWPLLAAGLIYTRKEKRKRGSWYLGILIACAMLLMFGWVYNVRMGQEGMVVNIAAFVLIMAIGFAVAFWIPVAPRWRGGLLLAVGIVGVLVVVFTFAPPDTLLFADLSRADALYLLPC